VSERTSSRDQTPKRKVDQRRQPDPFKVAVQDRRPDDGRERKSHVLDRDHDARFEALDCRRNRLDWIRLKSSMVGERWRGAREGGVINGRDLLTKLTWTTAVTTRTSKTGYVTQCLKLAVVKSPGDVNRSFGDW
jgi:hypothetical protein